MLGRPSDIAHRRGQGVTSRGSSLLLAGSDPSYRGGVRGGLNLNRTSTGELTRRSMQRSDVVEALFDSPRAKRNGSASGPQRRNTAEESSRARRNWQRGGRLVRYQEHHPSLLCPPKGITRSNAQLMRDVAWRRDVPDSLLE